MLTAMLHSVAIPIATYAFGGVEIIAVTAIEARDPSKSLKRPSRSIAIILAVAYLLSVLGFYLNVSWQDPSLPSMSSRANQHTTSGTSVVLIATGKSNIPGLSKFLNGCLIMAVFSAANTTLYVASRTLFGLTKTIKPGGPALSKLLYRLGTTNPSTRVPSWAVVVSALAFVWLPVTHVASNFSDRRVNIQTPLPIRLIKPLDNADLEL
jgi:amino acid permease